MDQALWDAIAKVERRHWWFRGRRELVAALLVARLAKGSRVLDVGCGTGFVLERLLDDYDAWGLEPDAAVRARAADPVRERVLAGGTTDLTAVQGQQFDGVLLLDVLEHLDDDVAALRAVAPLLGSRGILLTTVPAYPRLWSSHDVRNAHRRRYTRSSLLLAFSEAGYIVDVLSHINSRLFPLAMLHRLAAGTAGHRTDRELAVPPGPLNELFASVFAGEARGVERGYRYGLSLVAVARPGA